MEMNLHFRVEGSVIRVHISGEIDTYTAPNLREKLEAIQITNGVRVKLDLSKVVYMDSTGLGIIVAFYKRVTKSHAELKLVGLSTRLIRLFDITGLSELIHIETNEKVEAGHESI